MKVMVVEDEKFSLEKIKEQVSEFEFVNAVYAFDNPYHALGALKLLEIDVAILDIEMFGMTGIELAKQCKCINPELKIIFLTGYSDYALSAFKVRANGYLLKPASSEEIKTELLELVACSNSIDLSRTKNGPTIRIQTFGNFEVFVNNKPIEFERTKAKELLAYVVSRKGAYVNGDELLGVLYEDKPITPSSKSQLRTLTASLIKSLKSAGADGLILKRRNQLAIDKSVCNCDYYEFLEGNVETINSFMGEFMTNYSWAEFITGYLELNSTTRK